MTTFSPDLLSLLADPETHEPFTLASAEELTALKQAVAAGGGRRRNGQTIAANLDGALLCQGRRVAYLIEGGIPDLLIEGRVELDAPL